MGLATKEQILSAQDWDCEEFEVEKWGTIRMRALTARERLDLVEKYGSGNLTNEQAFGFFVNLISLSLIDEQGNRMFSEPGDMEALQNKSWPKLQSVAERIMAFNGMSDEGMVKN